MHDQDRGPDHGETDLQALDPAGTAHELLNVLVAVQIHVFMARTTFLAADSGESTSGPGPSTPADLMLRLESMVDRAVGLATELDEQVRALRP